MKKRFILLCVWSLAIIIPTALIGRFSPLFRRLFDSIFAPTWMHVLMHTALFAILVVILARTLSLAISFRTVLITTGIIVGVGLLQEGFQALEQGYFLPGGALADLGVDLGGGLVGMVIAYGLAAIKSKAYWASS